MINKLFTFLGNINLLFKCDDLYSFKIILNCDETLKASEHVFMPRCVSDKFEYTCPHCNYKMSVDMIDYVLREQYIVFGHHGVIVD